MDTYDAKLARRLRIRSNFPVALQNVPIHYVDEIHAFSPYQRELLVEAISKGGKLSEVLKKLKQADGDVTIDVLLAGVKAETSVAPNQDPFDPEDIGVLESILSDCFPNIPVASANAIAQSPAMAEARQLLRDLRSIMESRNASSDFVLITMYAAVKYAKKVIESKINSNQAFLQTVKSSGLVWEGENQ